MDTQNTFTKADAQLPFTVMALLDTCALAMDDISEAGRGEYAAFNIPSIAVSLRLANKLLIDFHAKLDLLDRLEVAA